MTASVATVEAKVIFESDYCLTLLKWRWLAAWSRLFSTALANVHNFIQCKPPSFARTQVWNKSTEEVKI